MIPFLEQISNIILKDKDAIAINSFEVGKTKKNITYQELYEEILKTSDYFTRAGIKKANVIALRGKNNYKTIVMVLALWKLESVPLILNNRLTKSEINAQIEFAKPGFIVNQDRVSPTNYFSHREGGANKTKSLIMFTSGSTRKPKAVVHTLNNLQESAFLCGNALSCSSNDRWLLSLPIYHIGGFSIFTRAIYFGSSIVIPKSLRIDDIISAIMEDDPTHLSFVSVQLEEIILRNIRANKSHKYLLLGGGPLSDDKISKATELGWNVCKVYGSTETASFITILKKENFIQKKSSAGLPLKNIVIKIYEGDKELTSNQIGEICISSPTLFCEYLFNLEETKERLANGFYKSGDIGFLDEDGFLFVVSRKSDMIISGGENISPAEIEKAIMENPKIKECCVFGMSDDKWGEVVAAALVLNENTILDYSELKKYLIDKVANFKIPKKIFIMNALPKTELGKIKQEALRIMCV
jgi:O-succinylbenzoic acid--CoA ligase